MATNICTSGVKADVKTGPLCLTHQDIPTQHKPDATVPYLDKIKTMRLRGTVQLTSINLYRLRIKLRKEDTTAYVTVISSSFSFKIHLVKSLSIIKLKMAD